MNQSVPQAPGPDNFLTIRPLWIYFFIMAISSYTIIHNTHGGFIAWPLAPCLHHLLVSGLVLAVSCGQSDQQQTQVQQSSSSSQPAIAVSLADLIAPGDTLVLVTPDIPGLTSADAVLWDEVGYLFFNQLSNDSTATNYRMGADGSIVKIRENNGSSPASHKSPQNTIYATEMNGHRIVEIDTNGNVLRVVVSEYNGKPLDNPNDLIFDAKGGFYFSDSRFRGTQFSQDLPAIYYVSVDGTNTRGADKGQYVYAFDVNEDGTLANKRAWATIELTEKAIADSAGSGGADGCAIDVNGNLYVSTLQGLGVQVFNAEGKHLGNIPTGGRRSNTCKFGGVDMKTLYVATQNSVSKINVNIPGLKLPIGSK